MTRFHPPPVESFYLETKEGLYFAVKGLLHPPQRILSVLRYAPDPHGDRKKGDRTYRRFYHFPEQLQTLEHGYARYLAYDPASGLVQQSVPHSSIQRIYDPRLWLQAIAHAPQRDPLQDDALAFCDLLAKEAGVSREHLGVSGSLLIDMHTPHSDLDLTVHGERNCRLVHQALQRLLDSGSIPELSRFDRQGFQGLYQERVKDTRMEFNEFIALESRKSIQGLFRRRTFFVRFIKESSELDESYGDHLCQPLHPVVVVATVTGAADAIFTPCRYPLTAVQFLQGDPVESLDEIVSYRGRFCEQAHPGERVRASGTLERVRTLRGRTWHRLILGNRPEDAMTLWR